MNISNKDRYNHDEWQEQDNINESSPLIRPPQPGNTNNNNNTPLNLHKTCDQFYFYAKTNSIELLNELKIIFRLASPLLVTFLLGKGMQLVNVWYFGKLSPQIMAAVSLGNLFTTVCGFAFGNGLLTAIDTLVSQAFTGAHNPQTLGIILQRSIVIMALFSVPFGILWYYGEYVLLWMGQDPQLASMAQTYLYFAIPALLPTFISTAIRKFVQSLGKMKITMYMVIVIFPLNHLVDHILLSKLDIGMYGVSLQNTLFHLIVLIVYGLFLYYGTDFKKKYWPGYTKEAFHHWREFLKLGIPGMLSVSTDWAFEVCALITGVLGETNLAAQNVVISVNSFLIMIPTAISNALTVRLGHYLGANQPEKAKACAIISFVLGFIIVTINSIIIYAFRYQIASYFTNNELIVDTVVELFIIVSPCHFVVGIGTVLSGILNAFGKQYIVATFNLTSYYIIGLPFGIWLTFSHQSGLVGVWSGVAIAGLIKCVGEGFVLIYSIDWENECYLAMKRVADQELSRTII